ncbi:MAG: hypothetical protein ACM3RX_09270 [Methanococcaceae archaeon]
MKKNILILSVTAILLLAGTIAAGALLDYFHAASSGDNVKIEWKTFEENDVSSFAIERKVVNGTYTVIHTEQPKGSYSTYTYIDETAYKSSERIYIYHLKIVDKYNNVSYSQEEHVLHGGQVSGVKRTWGSIKAMFR